MTVPVVAISFEDCPIDSNLKLLLLTDAKVGELVVKGRIRPFRGHQLGHNRAKVEKAYGLLHHFVN